MSQSLTYLESLQATEVLLRKVGETTWADGLAEDIKLWKERGETQNHLSKYGGMGSFNDLVLCAENWHQVTAAQAPWIQALFGHLQNLCSGLARHPRHEAVYTEVGAPLKTESEIRIHGWRCLECGYSQLAPSSIDAYLTESLLPPLFSKDQVNLFAIVDAVLALQIDGLDFFRKRVEKALKKSEILIKEMPGWMRPCPSCRSDDTAAYRWALIDKEFRPTPDNLPVKIIGY